MRIIPALLIFFSGFAHAQPTEWLSGIITLKSNEVLSGDIFIDQLHDMAFFREGERVAIYPAFRIQNARYFDEHLGAEVSFVSVYGKATRAAEIYELVLPGRMSVLRKNYSRSVNLHEFRTEYQYFVWVDGDIIPIHKFKSRVYKGYVDPSGELERFVKENNLDIRYSDDVVEAARFFNGASSDDAYSKSDAQNY